MNYTLDSHFGVKDEVIVVCGGTRGIGREIANGLADLGAKLAIVATKQPACDQATEELKARGAQDAIGCAALQQWTMPLKFTSTTWLKSAMPISSSGRALLIPAQFTRPSIV